MILAIVKGEVVATVKHPAYESRRLLLVDRIDGEGAEQGGYLVVVDSVGAGVGETVLVIDEGGSAQQVLDAPSTPTIASPARSPLFSAGLPVITWTICSVPPLAFSSMPRPTKFPSICE